MSERAEKMSFWSHLDELRKVLLRILTAILVAGVVAFCFKDILFSILLAPQRSDFVLYRLLDRLGHVWHVDSLGMTDFHVQLISTQLTSQFFIHMYAAFAAGAVIVSPYILFELFRFVSPALYVEEKHYAFPALIWSFLLFSLGVLLNYFIIFPFSFRFLATYQVSAEVPNMITLSSYMEALLMMSLLLGLMFELPVLCWLFARLGFLTSSFMRNKRRYAVVIILIAAAVITPTGDAFTLALVSLPVWALYEISILVVAASQRKSRAKKNTPPVE
ncbi:MAG: twin-arginine translocase subunit TatC [Bacteroidales bacterium]|nr:twin-arginine translocase subunit TatC [Bacteroidales bacterium]